MAGSEIDTLLGSLERQSATLGLEVRGPGRVRAPSDRRRLHGHSRWSAEASRLRRGLLLLPPVVGSAARGHLARGGLEGRPGLGVTFGCRRFPDELMALWTAAADRSRASIAEALASGGPEQLARFTWPDGKSASLRRILVDLIEEYARHVGHADLIGSPWTAGSARTRQASRFRTQATETGRRWPLAGWRHE
jgi:hypothetical protein